jgi:50S ribosome-binding GTPase
MPWSRPSLDAPLTALQSALGTLNAARYPAVERFRADLAAARFHLNRSKKGTPLLAILGGTGTGKSTLLNRLLGSDITATSFRRTFTAGAIAVISDPAHIPVRWLGLDHDVTDPTQLPARGQHDRLTIVAVANQVSRKLALIDTPDLDGDQPAHHAQADRVFRWADAVLFLVTPEKYQMTELLPYYRLAKRYGLPALHVMNKVEERAVLEDYAQQSGATVYAIPRDDAAYEPPAEQNLNALRQAIANVSIQTSEQGNSLRVIDLMDRLRDQIIEPMSADRGEVDRLVKSLRAMVTPAPGVDVNPLTHQLQRRLQQRSVLYLMGPGRVLDRVRQVPGILARLPRTTWDLLRSGRLSGNGKDDGPTDLSRDKPNFNQAMNDQFTVVQSRIDDAIRSSPRALEWIDDSYSTSKLDVSLAGQIADDEINQLQMWLQQRWDATPRDTAMIEKLMKLIPGGQKLTKWSESAPYLLAIVVATHGAFFGHLDLLILGGWSLATWLGEKLSNEVASRARQANNAIAARFTDLAHRQIEQTCAWLEQQAPTSKVIAKLAQIADDLSESTPHLASPGTPYAQRTNL